MIGLRQKLSLGFGGLLLIILIIGGQSIVEFRDLGQSIDVILRENYRSVVACQEMKEALERMDSGILFVLLGYDEEGKTLIRANEERFEKALAGRTEQHHRPGGGGEGHGPEGALCPVPGNPGRDADAGACRRSPAGTGISGSCCRCFEQVKDTADDILRMNQNNMNDANEKARRQAAFARQRMYLFLLVRLPHRGGLHLLHRTVDPAAHQPSDPFRRGDPGGKPGPRRARRIPGTRSAGCRRRSTTWRPVSGNFAAAIRRN